MAHKVSVQAEGGLIQSEGGCVVARGHEKKKGGGGGGEFAPLQKKKNPQTLMIEHNRIVRSLVGVCPEKLSYYYDFFV